MPSTSWLVQDGSGDVAAVVADGTRGGRADGKAAVVAQMRYDAYGQVIAADHLRPHPFIGVGHKGLFFDRFDRGVSDSQAQGAALPPPGSASGTLVETPLVVPFARGIYHNRNRTYMPGGGSPQVIAQAGITGPNSQGNWTLSQSGLASGAAAHGRVAPIAREDDVAPIAGGTGDRWDVLLF